MSPARRAWLSYVVDRCLAVVDLALGELDAADGDADLEPDLDNEIICPDDLPARRAA